MCRRKISLFILFIILNVRAFAAVFVVTSNADSGPGTLRDALTQAAANGSIEKDYINFNLPGTTEANRTIALQSQLPDVSSNLVIDGTTQTGPKFGASDAKVKITNKFVYPVNLNTFYSNGGDQIEIYGLWLYNDMNGWGGSAFHFRNFGTIKIGAPQKGNLVEWGNIGIDTGKTCYFQNNICWTNVTGLQCTGGNITIIACDKVIFGGSADAGNTLGGTCYFVYTMPTESTAEVSFNRFGTDITGLAAPWGFDVEADRVSFTGGTVTPTITTKAPVNAVIKNNVFADVYDASLLSLSTEGGKFLVQGNSFNTDFTGTVNLNLDSHGGPFWGISTAGDVDAIIGGSNPAEKNVIAYCLDGVGSGNSGKFLVTRNSIFCYGEKPHYSFRTDLPHVEISTITATTVKGTATPNSTIEIFHADCGCYHPDPKDYLATITADNNGKWVYNGPIGGVVMASATLNDLTGEFSQLSIDETALHIVNATCDGFGSIKGLQSPYLTGYRWYDAAGTLVGSTPDLTNVPPGTYTLKVGNGTACDLTKTYAIQDNSLKSDLSHLNITNYGCNSQGSITGIQLTLTDDYYQPAWYDAQGNKICDCIDLTNAMPGIYEFKVHTRDNKCEYDFGDFEIKSTQALQIDQSAAKVQPTNCGQSTGYITNIKINYGSGALKYIWWNGQQQQVGTDKDLLNQPAGTYKLQVSDNTSCVPIYTTDITIPETNGITLDESGAVKTDAGCGLANGSITGITASGATKFEWRDANNQLKSSTADLIGVGAGDYKLTTSNGFGCSRESAVYHVNSPAPIQFPQYNAAITSSCFASNDGSISVTTDALVKTLRWIDAQGTFAGDQPTITNLVPGTYRLYLTDQNGCEGLYNSYTVVENPEFTVANRGDVTEDQCGLKTGAINNVTIAGGVPPYTYSWTNGSGNSLGSTNLVSGLSPGNYTLHVVDTRCGIVDIPYTITETTAEVSPPAVSDVVLCSSGGALISVNDPSATTTYRLYEDGSGVHPADERQGGRFSVNVTGNRSYFVSQFNGTCESSRAEIKVTVGLSAVNINNTFTPNGDGVNDYWMINSNIQNYPDAMIQVFTRYGQKVFEEKGYAKPFDGTMSGNRLPAGVYYYIIKLNNDCSILSGSLTIVR